jgi:hypothetical protein
VSRCDYPAFFVKGNRLCACGAAIQTNNKALPDFSISGFHSIKKH